MDGSIVFAVVELGLFCVLAIVFLLWVGKWLVFDHPIKTYRECRRKRKRGKKVKKFLAERELFSQEIGFYDWCAAIDDKLLYKHFLKKTLALEDPRTTYSREFDG